MYPSDGQRPNTIDVFIKYHKDFIKNNKRGYGYWIWKHKVIIEKYNTMEMNDILVYSDSGNTINSLNIKMVNYINTLINKTGILLFPINHKEGDWSKMDVIKTIVKEDINNVINNYQTMGGLMMFRKCTNTTMYLQEVAKYSIQYNLINDSISKLPNIKNFKEHRYDQSIFSLVKYNYKYDLSYDLFDDRPNNNCFITSRKK